MRAVVLGAVPSAFAALSVGDPGDACATLSEPLIGTNGYARQAITWSAVSTPVSGAPAILQNSNQLVWTSTGPWAASLVQACSHIAVFSAATGTSESIYIGADVLTPARLMDRAGIVILVPAGALQITIGLKEN